MLYDSVVMMIALHYPIKANRFCFAKIELSYNPLRSLIFYTHCKLQIRNSTLQSNFFSFERVVDISLYFTCQIPILQIKKPQLQLSSLELKIAENENEYCLSM